METKNSKLCMEMYLEMFEDAFQHDSAQDEVGCITVAFQVDAAHLEKIEKWRLQFSMLLELLFDISLPKQPFIKDDDDYNRKLALQLYSLGHVAFMRMNTTFRRVN